MKRRLPPLNAVRAFEVAARHGSFVLAAEELAVTPAAISHQVKGLEENLDLQLFVRHHRSVDLTPAGQALLPGLTDAFDRLGRCIDDVVRQARGSGPLTVRAPAAFAARWLTPRLERFFATAPEVQLRIEPDGRPAMAQEQDSADELGDDVDLAVRQRSLAAGQGAGWDGLPLFSERLFPLCLPVTRMALSAPANLTRQTLLHDDSIERWADGAHGWKAWLAVAGVPGLKPAGELAFAHFSPGMDAALRGQGVVLGRGALVDAELKSGALVRPFQITAPAGTLYSVDWPRHRLLRPQARLFADWLAREADQFCSTSPHSVDRPGKG